MKMPNSVETENYIISCMLSDNSCIDKIQAILKPDCFYDPENRQYCKNIFDLYNSGIEVTPLSLHNIMKDSELSIFISMSNSASSVSNAEYSARVIYEKFMKRNLIKVAKDILIEVEDETRDIFDLITESSNSINSVVDSLPNPDSTLYERLPDILQQIKNRMVSKSHEGLESTYFPSFNKYTGGILPGEMISLSGKDKSGKTTFAYKLVLDFAINSNIPIGIFSYEMNQRILDWKALSLETGIKFNKLRNPNGYFLDPNTKLTEKELENVAIISNRKFRNTEIYTCDKVLNEQQIRSKIKGWMKDFDVKFFLIDYIGLIPTVKKHETREREISYLSRYFKGVTQDLGINLMILSQQNREGGIAESLGLERDPDFAFTIHKPAEEGITSIKINGQSFAVDENDFIITLKRNRMDVQNKQFIVGYTRDNRFCELDKTRGDKEPVEVYQEQRFDFTETEREEPF